MLKKYLAVRNVNIITMNPQQPRAEALTIREGNIVAVGSWDDVEPHTEGVPVLDLAGKAVVPGLIDTHTHFLWTALSLAALDVSGADDHTALQHIIREAVADTPVGEPILGMGFTEGTPGIMVDADGQPNGLLADRANNEAFGVFGEQYGTDEKAGDMVTRGVERAHSVGLTTVHALEGGDVGDDVAAEEFLAAIPTLPLRFVFYYQILDVERVLELGLPRIGGCILLDGDVGPHTAALSEPYVGDPACYGTLYHTQEEIDAFVLEAHKAGLQVAMHAVGDAAVEQALDAYEAALNAYPRNDHRHRIEHCEVIREEQIQRALRLGVALAIQPPFNHYWDHGTYYPSLGYERAWRADPVGSLMRPGLLMAGGSDSTVTPLGPLIGVHAAVNHSNPAERTSVYKALELYTINAARIAFQEHDRGSLEVGKLGDFVVLAEDPFEIDPRSIKDIPVEKTVIGGQIVYEGV
jgi:predicted amidohydrolase YtcJ